MVQKHQHLYITGYFQTSCKGFLVKADSNLNIIFIKAFNARNVTESWFEVRLIDDEIILIGNIVNKETWRKEGLFINFNEEELKDYWKDQAFAVVDVT